MPRFACRTHLLPIREIKENLNEHDLEGSQKEIAQLPLETSIAKTRDRRNFTNCELNSIAKLRPMTTFTCSNIRSSYNYVHIK